MACDDHARRASSSCQKPQTRAEFAAPCTRISGGRSPSHTRRVGARSLDMRHILRGTKSHRIECGAFWIEEPRSGVPGTERTVTIVNSMRVLAVGVLVLLCHACDRTPPSSGPPEGPASREAAPAAPAPSSKPEAQRPVETHTPPRAEDRKSTRLNSSHSSISYAVFCLKKKNCVGRGRSRVRRHLALRRIGDHSFVV